MSFIQNIFEPKTESFFSKKENIGIFSLFVLLWIYLFFRGVYLPLMHDEVATFYFYIQSGVVFPPEAHYDANNHVLNSLLSHWSYQIFGSSPLAIRLPNVLAFAAFFYGIKGIASRMKSLTYRWGFLLAVTMSYFVFEYFSETRGYGLSLAFLAIAIFQYFKLTESGHTKHILIAGVYLWLATSANLTILISSIILFTLMGIHSLLFDFKTNKKRLIVKILSLLACGLPFLILVEWSFKLKELGLLYYGSLEGFYKMTVTRLFEVFVGSYHIWMAVLVTLFFVVVVAFLVWDLIKKKSLIKFIEGQNVLPILLVGSVLMINLLAWVMKINYPEDRAAIYLFIYLAGGFAFVMSRIAENAKWTNAFVLPFAFFPITFIAGISLRQASFWVDARNSQPIFDQVKQIESDFKYPLLVGGYATQELCWYYMNHQEGGNYGRLHWTNHPGIDADVELISPTRMENPLVNDYYDSLFYDKAADLIYFKRKKPLTKTLVKEQSYPDIINTKQEYYTLFQVPADSFINKTLFIGTECTLDAKSKPFRSRLVAASEGNGESNLMYEYIQLDWLKKDWNGESNNLLQGTIIHNVPENAELISFYLWNPDTTEFSITNGTCHLYELERDY